MAKPKRGKAAPQKSREELRRENRQALEQKKSRQKALLIVGIVAAVIFAAAILSVTVFFHISAIEVDASKSQYAAGQIREASGIEEGDNLFLMKREEAAGNISHKLPYTGEITVKRAFPNKVRIYVEDSEVAAAVKYNDEYIVLNESNKVLAKVGSIDSLNSLVEQQEKKRAKYESPKKTKTAAKKADDKTTTTTTTTTSVTDVSGEGGDVTTALDAANIAGGEDITKASDQVTVITGVKVKSAKVGYPLVAKNSSVFKTYQEIRSAMDRWGVKDITAADLTKVSDIRLTYQQRIEILLGSATELDRKAAMCAKVLEEQNKISTEQKGSIDLSINGKAYFSEGGATTRTTTLPTIPSTEVVTDVDGNPVTTVPSSDGSGTTVPGETTAASETTKAGETTGPGTTTTTASTTDLADTGG